jgi:DNA-binding transcriptional LysR family regulator
MNLDALATFVHVVDGASFTAAAKQLGVPTSTVSREIARLEETLGTRLLHRTTRKVALTSAGAKLYERVRPHVTALREAARDVPEKDDDPAGSLRITVPNDLGTSYFADVVADFLALHPQVQIDVRLTARQVDVVAEGIDLALRIGKMKDATLVARRVGTLDAALFASPGYLARHGRPTAPLDLLDHACLLFRMPDGRPTGWSLTGPEGRVDVTPDPQLFADDYAFLRGAALAGAGVAMLPGFLAAADVAAGRLERLLPRHDAPRSPLYAAYPSGRHLPRKVTAFRDFLVQALRARPLSQGA